MFLSIFCLFTFLHFRDVHFCFLLNIMYKLVNYSLNRITLIVLLVFFVCIFVSLELLFAKQKKRNVVVFLLLLFFLLKITLSSYTTNTTYRVKVLVSFFLFYFREIARRKDMEILSNLCTFTIFTLLGLSFYYKTSSSDDKNKANKTINNKPIDRNEREPCNKNSNICLFPSMF